VKATRKDSEKLENNIKMQLAYINKI